MDRAPLTLEEKAQNLTSPLYAGDPVLEAAYDNSPGLKKGRTHLSVGKVQRGLVDEGFAMPKSTKPDGNMDGIYGSETKAVVILFQEKHGLASKDGIVGRQTMGRLDQLAGGPAPPKPEKKPSSKEMGERVVEGMKKANAPTGPDKGVHYDFNYHAAHLAEPDKYPWDEDWRSGLANESYFERLGWMDWRLKPGKSASEGIKAWLEGLTIAECLSCIIAIQIDAMRDAIGDDQFDTHFGSSAVPVQEDKRLRIRTGTQGTPLEGRLKDAHGSDPGEAGTIGNRPVQKGDWVYFYNHPKYLLKHPGGAFQGENAVYMGDESGQQLWSGLGVDSTTERDMLQTMAHDYNVERRGDDYVNLLERYAGDAPEVTTPSQAYRNRDVDHTRGLYEKYIDRIPSHYREDSGEFADEVTVENVLNDPPYTIDGTERKGGYLPQAASRLDPDAVGELMAP